MQGREGGPIAGISARIKDLLRYQDVRTTGMSKIIGNCAEYESPSTSQLGAGGAVMLGKLNNDRDSTMGCRTTKTSASVRCGQSMAAATEPTPRWSRAAQRRLGFGGGGAVGCRGANRDRTTGGARSQPQSSRDRRHERPMADVRAWGIVALNPRSIRPGTPIRA